MNTYVLLFRAINVGGRNILPMKALTAMLEKMGYSNIRTYIQSGNVVLQGDGVDADAIRDGIRKKFGFMPDLMVLEAKELTAAAGKNPYKGHAGNIVHCYFCAGKPALDKDRIARLKSANEEFTVSGKVFYLYAPDGIGKSKLAANIETCLGTSATGRNLNTVNKLLEMLQPET